jgi:uncharacterized protein with WD repeat
MLAKIGSLLLAIISLALLGCGDGIAHYPENDGIPNNCEYTTAEYYRPNIFARFDNNHRSVQLVDWTTGDTVYTLAQDVDAANVEILSWSPNCRYLTVRQDGNGVIYDITNGAHIGSFPHVSPFSYDSTSVTWDSTSTYVTVESGHDTILLDAATGTQVTLAPYHFRVQYWDLPHNEVITFSQQGVKAYDLSSGAIVAKFEGIQITNQLLLNFSPDHSLIAFYLGGNDSNVVSVWNRDSMTHIDINTGYYVYPVVAFSADNRYLAMGGFTLSIWDLQNPPQDAKTHAPLFQYTNTPTHYINNLRFIDDSTIEITDDGHVLNWNFVTGKQVK